MAKPKKNTAQTARRPRRNLTNSRYADVDPEESPYPPPSKLRQRSIPELFFDMAEDRETAPFAQFREIEDRSWSSVNWREAAEQVGVLAGHLASNGVKKGDRVAILSSTRYEWVIADLAILSLGAISVSVFQTLTPGEVGFVLCDSGAQHVIAENTEQVKKLEALEESALEMPATESFPGGEVRLNIKSVVTFEAVDSPHFGARLIHLPTLVKETSQQDIGAAKREARRAAELLARDDLATIVYTSATTGLPKGVVQTHNNHLAMADMILLSGIMGTGRGVFLYLPLAHSFARVIPLVVIAAGGDLFFPTVVDRQTSRFDAKQLLADIAASSPMIFPSVPRIFEKIMTVLTPEHPRTRKERLIKWALELRLSQLDVPLDRRKTSIRAQFQRMAADVLVAQVRRKLFGSRLLFAVSGGAPISVEVLRFFKAMGVLILEGYGLTETTPALCVNTPEYCRFGTVGRPFPGVELRTSAEDGEILCRGPNVAKGYWMSPEATSAVFLKDGWFATGDIGEIDEDGYLKITDRKKDIIVTAGGKKVPPALLEGKLKTTNIISHALVYGDRKPYLVALITLDEIALREWARGHAALESLDVAELILRPEVQAAVQRAVDALNEGLAGYEQVKRFRILSEDFSIDNGLLGPSLKLKRKVAVERYRQLIESLYHEGSPGSARA